MNKLKPTMDTTLETWDDHVAIFFEELCSNQEPLGYECEQVLFENIWDLYQN
jgi:hypothetical protein